MGLFVKTALATLCLLVGAAAWGQDPPEVEHYLMLVPSHLTPEQRDFALHSIREHVARVKHRGGAPDGFRISGSTRRSEPGLERLGTDVTTPPDALAEQFDLPAGQGLLLAEVRAGSAAARAGLKTHDILLEVDGRPVARDQKRFGEALSNIKDRSVTVVVMRKGRNETIKGLELATASAVPAQPGAFPVGAGRRAMTTVFRTGERFTARHEDGSIIITLVGDRHKVSEVVVQDGRASGKYDSLDKVPAPHREAVQHLFEQIENKKP